MDRVHKLTPTRLLFLMAALGLLVPMPAADWPQWRGPHRDGHSSERLSADRDPLQGLQEPIWRRSVGRGYASPVVSSGTLVWLDAVQDQETAHAADVATGTPRWSVTVGPVFSDEFEPGPRCTPVVDGDRVYVQTALGEFQCLDLRDGSLRWRFHFGDYGMRWVADRASNIGAASRRGNTGSPVVDGERILVQVGSTNGACLVAFDKRTGRELWKSQNDLASFASPVVGAPGGRRQCVTVTCEGLMGVAPEDGALLWRLPFKTGANRNVLTPILLDDTVYYASHTTGLRATRIRPDGATLHAGDVWLNRDARINLSSRSPWAAICTDWGPPRTISAWTASPAALRGPSLDSATPPRRSPSWTATCWCSRTWGNCWCSGPVRSVTKNGRAIRCAGRRSAIRPSPTDC